MKPLFLIGYMGCGKSTLGRRLARRLGAEFADTDALIERREGASVEPPPWSPRAEDFPSGATTWPA